MEVKAMRENPTSFKYDAFISYRHSEPDKTIAERLHRMLETFKVPKAIIKKGSQKRVGRVFRDRDELPTSSNLAENIQAALADSEHLIVICSPRTPQSQWVTKEIETFSALHGHDRVLALLIEGEPSESFPDALRYVKKQVIGEDGTLSEIITEIEPLAADIRDKSLAGMKKKLKVEILRLLAPILNCRFDDLKQRHRERMIKRVLTISISLSVFFLGFGSITAYQSMLIRQQSEVVRQQSEIVQEKSELVQQQAEQLKRQVQETLAGQSLYLSDVSRRLLQEGDRKAAILVALEALPKNLDNPERPYREEAELALCKALQVYDTRFALVPDTALQHDKYVNFIKLSPDGGTAVTSAQDGYLYIWETEYGHLQNKLYIDDSFLDSSELLFLDDSTIVCVTSDKAFRLNVKTMAVEWESEVSSLCSTFSPDQSRLAVYDYQDVLKVIDTANGAVLLEYAMDEYLKAGEAEYRYTSCLNFDAASRYILIGTSNARVVVVDVEAQRLAVNYNAHYSFVKDIEMTGDGRLAVISNDADTINLSYGSGFLEVYNIKDDEKLMEMDFKSSALENLTFHPANSSLLMFNEYAKLNVMDLDKKELAYSFNHGDSVSGFIPLDTQVLSASYDGTIRLFLMSGEGFEHEPFRIVLNQNIKGMELASGKLAVWFWQSDKPLILRNLENPDFIVLENSLNYISGAHFTEDSKKMLTYYYGGDILVWDTETHKQTAHHEETGKPMLESAYFVDQDSKIFCVYYEKLVLCDANDLKVISTDESDSILAWDVTQDLSLAVISRFDSAEIIRTADLSVVGRFENISGFDIDIFPDNSKVMICSKYSDSSVCDMKTYKVLAKLPKNITDAAVSPDGKTIALIIDEKTIHILDAETYQEIGVIDDFNIKAEKLFFDPQSETLFAALDDHSVRRYSLDNLSLIAELEGLQSSIKNIVFNQDKDLYAINGIYHETIIFHNSNNKKLAEINDVVVFDPDFNSFISSPDTTLIQVPYYSLRELMEEAQRQLGGRTLTDKEKAKYFIVD
jgi:WD40 repeat protein